MFSGGTRTVLHLALCIKAITGVKQTAQSDPSLDASTCESTLLLVVVSHHITQVGAGRKGSGQVDPREPHIPAQGGINEKGKFMWYYTPARPLPQFVPAAAAATALAVDHEGTRMGDNSQGEPGPHEPTTTTQGRGILKSALKGQSSHHHHQDRPLTKAIIFSQFMVSAAKEWMYGHGLQKC